MERPTAMPNCAGKELNPVRHLGGTVCQKHVSASPAAPLGWLRSERQEPNLKQGWNTNNEDFIESVDVRSDGEGIGAGRRNRGPNRPKAHRTAAWHSSTPLCR